MKKDVLIKMRGLCLGLVMLGVLSACGGGGGGAAGTVGEPNSTTGNPTGSGSAPQPQAIQNPLVLMEVSSANIDTLTASWLPVTDGAAGQIRYRVHISTNPDFTADASNVAFEGTDVVTATLTSGVRAGTTYYVRVTATDFQGRAVLSNIMSVTVADTAATLRSGSSVKTYQVKDVLQVNPDNVMLQPGVPIPAVGQYIASPFGAGFLRKVSGIAETSAGVKVETQAAALDEVLASAQVSAAFTLPDTSLSASGNATQAGFVIRSGTPGATSNDFFWSASQLHYMLSARGAAAKGVQVGLTTPASTEGKTTKVFSGSGDFKVANEFSYNFDPTIAIESRLALTSGLEYAKVVATVAPTLDQKLTITSTASGTVDKTMEAIPPRKFTKIIMVGEIPVFITGTFKMDMRITGAVSGNIQATEKISLRYKPAVYGFKFEKDVYTEIASVNPSYEFKVGGKGKAEANLQISLLPSMQVDAYESVTGKLVLEPYLGAAAGLEGIVQLDTSVSTDDANWRSDADYRLTKGTMSTGLRAWLYADLHGWGHKFAVWPKDAKTDQYTSYKKVDVVAETQIIGLPSVSGLVDYAAVLPNGDSRAIKITAVAGNVPNPLKALFANLPDSFVTWTQWSTPHIIPPLGVASDTYSVISSPAGSENGETWVLLTKPGTYTVRIGGFGSWGNWARQYTDVQVTARTECRAPQVFQDGACVTPSVPICTAPKTLQNGVCTLPPLVCPSPQIVRDGTCIAPAPTCGPSSILQNGTCVTIPDSVVSTRYELRTKIQGLWAVDPATTCDYHNFIDGFYHADGKGQDSDAYTCNLQLTFQLWDLQKQKAGFDETNVASIDAAHTSCHVDNPNIRYLRNVTSGFDLGFASAADITSPQMFVAGQYFKFASTWSFQYSKYVSPPIDGSAMYLYDRPPGPLTVACTITWVEAGTNQKYFVKAEKQDTSVATTFQVETSFGDGTTYLQRGALNWPVNVVPNCGPQDCLLPQAPKY